MSTNWLANFRLCRQLDPTLAFFFCIIAVWIVVMPGNAVTGISIPLVTVLFFQYFLEVS